MKWPTWLKRKRQTRPIQVVLYSRIGCHLCDVAKAILEKHIPGVSIQEVDIDEDPDLRLRFDQEVPVIEIDGQIRFRGRINEVLLRRLLRQS